MIIKTIRVLLACFFLLFSQPQIFGQEVNPKLAEALQHALDSMHQILGINGISASLQLSNDAVWAGSRGVSTFQPIDSISSEHVFATGSSTKTITSMCILQLVDEGVLTLDDSLHLWLPSFPHIDPNINIRQLLRHQSGLYDVLQNSAFQPTLLQNPNQLWELEDIISTFIKAPDFPPGTSWAYSNTNYILAGMIIEAATGMSFHEVVNQRFFEPLGLESYANLAYDPVPEHVAHLWLDLNGDGQLDDAHNFFTGWKSMFSAVGPAGGYFASASDLARWIRASMSGSLVSSESWVEATTTVNSNFSGNTKYGLGLMERNHLGIPSYGHGGDLSYSTRAVYFPSKDISIVVLANDASINSWSLTGTVNALLRTYLDCEAVLLNTNKLESQFIPMDVYPNPVSNWINVQFKLDTPVSRLELQLVNVNGQTVHQHTYGYAGRGDFRESYFIPESVQPGFYLLELVSEEKIIGRTKISVQ